MSKENLSRRKFGKTALCSTASLACLSKSSSASGGIAQFKEYRDIDVLVAGGGMAGVFAALGAKSDGLSVKIIEPSNVLGGQGTSGGVAGFCGDTARVNRPFSDFVSTLTKYNLIAPYNPDADRRPYDLEGCAFFLQEALMAQNIKPLLHSSAVQAVMDNGTVHEVHVATPGKIIIYRPKIVIDASGDCFLTNSAGFKTMHEGIFKQLPMSLYFTLWDTGKPVTPYLPPNCPEWDNDENIPMTTVHSFSSGKLEVKMKVIGFDSCDGESLSEAEIHARRQMMGLIYYLQTHGYRGKKYDSYVLSSVSRKIGIRGARRVVGDYILTEEDVKISRSFDDTVAIGTYHIDYHWPERVQRAGTGITTPLAPYSIPLRSLVVKGSSNLLAAGRCASADQMAMSSMRVMATCAQMGFAAGQTALHTLLNGSDLRNIPIRKIQKSLDANGQSLDISRYGEYLANKRSEVKQG